MDEGVHAPSTESQFPLSVLGSDLHTRSLLLAGAPAADVRTHTYRKRERLILDLIAALQLIILKRGEREGEEGRRRGGEM